MYKKIILSFLLIFCLVGCTAAQPSKEEAKKTIEQPYIKAVWLSYYELSSFTEDNRWVRLFFCFFFVVCLFVFYY